MKLPRFISSLFEPDLPAPIPAVRAQSPTGRDLFDSTVVRPEMAQLTRDFQEVNRRMLRMYDAAATTNFNGDMRGVFTSANTEVLGADYTVIARARNIVANTPHGKAAQRAIQNNVVGHDPYKLEMRYGKWVKKKKKAPAPVAATNSSVTPPPPADTGEEELKFEPAVEINRAIQAEWDLFGRPENFTVKGDMSRMEALRMAEGTAFTQGRVLVRHHREFPFNKYGYATEFLETDRLQQAYQGRARNGNPIRFSIEYDKVWNRRVAYWVTTKHPGDATGQSMLANVGSLDTQGNPQNFRVRIAAEDAFLYNNLRDRPEMDIGFTELDASIQATWRAWQYEKALVYAAIASCCKPFWIKKNFPTGMNVAASADELTEMLARIQGFKIAGGGEGGSVDQGQQGLRSRTSTEVAGATQNMEFGTELMQTDPKFPIEAASEFRKDNMRDIGVADGVSYTQTTGDFQSMGFVAGLMSQVPFHDNCKVRQTNGIDNMVRPIFREWLACTILTNVFEKKYGVNLDILKIDDYVEAARFKGRRWPFVNPLVEAQTLIILEEAGMMSPQQVQDRMEEGLPLEELYSQYAEANDEQAKHGLFFGDADVTRPTISKGEPGAVVPKPNGGEQSGTPGATKPGNPVRGNGRRSRVPVEALLAMSTNGEH